MEEIIGRYRCSVTPNDQDRNMHEVRLLLTQTRYEKENHGDRGEPLSSAWLLILLHPNSFQAALIVTNLASGALLFKGIIEDKWYFYDDSETRDPVLSVSLISAVEGGVCDSSSPVRLVRNVHLGSPTSMQKLTTAITSSLRTRGTTPASVTSCLADRSCRRSFDGRGTRRSSLASWITHRSQIAE